MVLFAKNRRYYLISEDHAEKTKKIFRKVENTKTGKIFDKRKNLIGKIKFDSHDIIVTEKNGVVCLRLLKEGSRSEYLIEDHFRNYLGKVKVSGKKNQEMTITDKNENRILFTQGFVEWNFIIQDTRKKKVAVGTTTEMMFSKDVHGIRHAKPSFLLSMKPHHPDSRFLLAIFIILLRKMTRIDVSTYYTRFGPALPF